MLDQIIGKYRLTRFIGEGGMANVYEGIHVTLGTKAAIKILNPILAKNDQFRQRFQNEAAFMASLNHPNITKVFDFEEDESHLAIVMELLEGMDLNDWVKEKGAFTFQAFKPIFDQILQAFNYAHNKGILHRDIKPSNIFIDPNGEVKILDFGIAKLFGTGNEMTQTGTQMGTPAYMSPEQVRADKSIDHRSDIYSLGVTLYFALAGKSPYDTENESQFDIFNKIVYENLPELKDNDLANRIIKKTCEKDRALRFQSVEEIEYSIGSNKIVKDYSKNTYAERFSNEGYSSQSNGIQRVNSNERNTKRKRVNFGLIIFLFTVVVAIAAYLALYVSKYSPDVKETKNDSLDVVEDRATNNSEIADEPVSVPHEATADSTSQLSDEVPFEIGVENNNIITESKAEDTL